MNSTLIGLVSNKPQTFWHKGIYLCGKYQIFWHAFGGGCGPLPPQYGFLTYLLKCMKRLVCEIKNFYRKKWHGSRHWAALCTCSKNICHKNSSESFVLLRHVGKKWGSSDRHDFKAFGTKSWLLDAICMLFCRQQQFFLIWICDRVGYVYLTRLEKNI